MSSWPQTKRYDFYLSLGTRVCVWTRVNTCVCVNTSEHVCVCVRERESVRICVVGGSYAVCLLDLHAVDERAEESDWVRLLLLFVLDLTSTITFLTLLSAYEVIADASSVGGTMRWNVFKSQHCLCLLFSVLIYLIDKCDCLCREYCYGGQHEDYVLRLLVELLDIRHLVVINKSFLLSLYLYFMKYCICIIKNKLSCIR